MDRETQSVREFGREWAKTWNDDRDGAAAAATGTAGGGLKRWSSTCDLRSPPASQAGIHH